MPHRSPATSHIAAPVTDIAKTPACADFIFFVDRYQAIANTIKQRYEIRVRRWRRSMSGCAWRAYFDDGRCINWIEAPRPKSPLSLAIFLHEVGHHVIGFDCYRTRCEEEHHAWMWALQQMHLLGVEATARVRLRVERSMRYAVAKALRRGMKIVPEAVKAYAAAA